MPQVQINSKLVRRNDIFIAIKSPNVHLHIQEAISNGASVVFTEFGTWQGPVINNYLDNANNLQNIKTNIIQVEDIFLLASKLSKFQFPKQPKCCTAITGTNGKSSVSWFINQLIYFSGKKSAMLGTVGLFINNREIVGNDINTQSGGVGSLNKISQGNTTNKRNENHNNDRIQFDTIIRSGHNINNENLNYCNCNNEFKTKDMHISLAKDNVDSYQAFKGLELITDASTIPLTTPDAFHLHKILQFLHLNSVEYLAFEASSAALDQKRLYSVNLETACMTNLASDHLDYHKTKEAYIQAKLTLFKEILPHNKIAIVNEILYDLIFPHHRNLVTFGFGSKNMVYATNITYCSNNTVFDLVLDGKVYKQTKINLVGEIQLLNVLCAIANCYILQIPKTKIINNIYNVTTLIGRLELVTEINGGKVFIDYAHTAEAFRQCLLTLKKYCNRLICIFGCGGDRDKSKRREMGEIAQNLVDIAIITDDNPRNENPQDIRQEIKKYCIKAIDIQDREEAIFYGLRMIQKNDILVIIGKGHETYQIYKNQTKYFSDRETVNRFYSIIELGR